MEDSTVRGHYVVVDISFGRDCLQTVLYSLTLFHFLIFQYFIWCKYGIVRFLGCYEWLKSPLELVVEIGSRHRIFINWFL